MMHALALRRSLPRVATRALLHRVRVPVSSNTRRWASEQSAAASHPNFAGYDDSIHFRNTHEPFRCFRVMDERGLVLKEELDPNVGEEVAVKIYKNMVELSVLDSIFYEAQRQGRISFYMTSLGEEAATVGSSAALDLKDVIFGQYRETGALIWRGFTFEQCANQCLGNSADPGKGRQMPIHYGSKEHNFQTISSPLGTQIPQAAGAGYALKREGSENIAVCYFGEGAASEGDFHAAINFAAVTSAHTLFICRNNGYAISTPVQEQYNGDGIAGRGPGYGIDTVRVDGNDVWAVYSATREARKRIIETGRPVLLELLSYRGGHHSTSDDASRYRPTDELAHWTATNNPVKRLSQYLQAKGWWSEDKEKALREDARARVLSALDTAEAKLKPKISELFNDVYAEKSPHLEEQLAEVMKHIAKYPEEYGVDQYEPESK
mmetsp:Transcript_2595/g.6136  ORF Transcript_2595/g.6136 Transcript_2595/m.6136 type:complete len:436 (+) Transcript_2595:3-1310(+)